tara:strand:+ start:1984 stop:2496 length:513 start_codon:yes stop_codon:yes gene_type:complete
MKTYEEFIKEAYEAKHNIGEGVGSVLRTAGRAIPGLQTAYGLGLGAYRLSKGDKTGAALAAASAIPGPIGWAALGADVTRDVLKDRSAAKPKPTAPKPSGSSVTPPKPAAPKSPGSSATPSKPAATPSQPAKPVLSKLGGVEGTGVGKDFVATKGGWKSGDKERYQKYSK